MTTTQPQPDFRRGAEAAAEASKRTAFARTQFFGIKDGESAILRFLTPADEWIIMNQHHMVPTKPKPDDYKGDNWPEKRGAICRNDVAFAAMYPDGCYICEYLVPAEKTRPASARIWALAVLREEVIENGVRKGIKDMTREVVIPAREAADGKPALPEETVIEKAVVAVNLGYRNFFSFLEGFAGRYGTVTDRDYHITRKGSDQSTVYAIVPEDPALDDDGNRIDPITHPDRWPHEIDLGEVITAMSSDEYYARWFDPRVTVSEKGEVEDTGTEVPKPSQDITEDKLAELKSRVRDYAGASSDGAVESNGEEEKPEAPATQPATTSGVADLG